MKISKNILLFTVLGILPTLMHAQNLWIDSLKKAAATEKIDSNRINALLDLSGAYRFLILTVVWHGRNRL